MLSFTLLGQTALMQNGLPLSRFRSQKEAALLIYLAHTGQTHQRDFLAELLWESSSTKQSLTNLRTALARLRKNIGEVLRVTRTTVALTPENLASVDSVTLLHGLASVGQVNTAENATLLQSALNSYRGDFLADFHLSDTAQFNQWVTETREHIRHQVILAYDKLGHYFLANGDFETGIAVARRWLQVDGLDEAAHTLLIQLLLESDRVREALVHYEQCAALLQRELGIAPPSDMTALISKARPQPVVKVRPTTAVSHHNLPPSYDQFFGRQNAQQEIHTRLDQPWCRLVTITGQGGVGKTRLATTIARSRLSQYPDGVWLVPLADVDPDDEDLAEAIAVEIATALDLRLTGSATPIEQLLNHLQHKQMMLVLDNFEHLLAGVQIVLSIVERCHKVQLVVTSREALRLRAEWSVRLTGLGYPTSGADELSSDAVELFAARRAQHQRGAISPDDLAAIRQICHLVAGLPLAIELAAALTRHTPIRAIANSLHEGFDALTTSLRDVPERHRGLQMVFEMSWRTLTPDLQQQLARLSIFRGGFTATAVPHITHAHPDQLAALLDKSLLTYHAETERYTIHPVIRAYAAGKRPSNDPTPHKHAHYYLTLLAQHTEPLQKEKPQESMHLLEPDIDNIRRAWQTGLSEQTADLLVNALTSLSIYYQLRGLAHEGESVMHNTMSAAADWGDGGVPLATRAGLERARFQNRLGQHHPAIQTIQKTLPLANQGDDRWAEGMAYVWWGESLWRLGEYDAAQEKLTHALDIAQNLNAIQIVGWCHHQLGIVHDLQGRYDTAHDHLENACAAWRKLHDINALSVSCNSLGIVFHHLGNLPVAQQTLEQSLMLCSQIDNRHLQSFLLNNLSLITTKQGDYLGSQYYLQLGLALASSTGNLTGQGQLYINLGRNYCMLGELELSVANLEKGLQISKLLGNQYVEATALLNLAVTRRAQGYFDQAISLYGEVLQISRQSHLTSIECEALTDLAELLSENDAKQAQKYSSQAVALAESIKSSDLINRANRLNQKLQSTDARNEKSQSK